MQRTRVIIYISAIVTLIGGLELSHSKVAAATQMCGDPLCEAYTEDGNCRANCLGEDALPTGTAVCNIRDGFPTCHCYPCG